MTSLIKWTIYAICILAVTPAWAATRYLDSDVAVSGDGLAWATAWKNFSNITGLSPGDIVEISGGAVSKTYTTGEWFPPNGTSGNPLTFRISGEAGHNGFVEIVASVGAPVHWIRARSPIDDNDGNWITISGEVNGAAHMRITAALAADFDNAQGLTFRYLSVTGYFRGYDSDSITIDHVTFELPGSGGWVNAGAVLGVGRNAGPVFYPTGYTRNTVHDCVIPIRTKNDSSGFGDDGLKNISNMSIYNNTFIAQVTTYTGVEHSDGIQASDGRHLKIYNNYFEGIANYPVYIESTATPGPYTFDVRVFNNVFYNNPSANIAMGNGAAVVTINDVIIANNTLVNGGIGIGANDAGDAYTNTYVINNLIYNTATATNLDATITASNNTNGTTTNITFVNPVSDFHLQASSSAAIDQGINPSYLTAISTTDKDGISVPQGSARDIGAYEFNQGGAGQSPNPPTGGTYLSSQRPASQARSAAPVRAGR